MKNLLIINIAFIFITSLLYGQVENLNKHAQMSLDCKKCHMCDTPTKSNPCLILCPRNKITMVRHSPKEGPEIIVLNEIKDEIDLYGPSNFSHRVHSEMSEMSGGCSICHHFNPPGKIVKCSTCHEPERQRIDLSIPDLKAAFHRQCMGCHKTWESETKCENCHLLNSSSKEESLIPTAVKTHDKIEMPERIVYETESEEGEFVTFFHTDHKLLFGHDCVDCHSDESCSNCHSQIEASKIEFNEHDGCSSCHDTEDNCTKCHREELAKPFNHKVKTGFDLKSYHSGLQCISCHKIQSIFAGLSNKCISCHEDRDGYFDHAITGLILDENHIENDCTDCHQQNNYKAKPSCDECHDDDIIYPDSLPGEKSR